jgi:hypothetical protein
MSRGRERRTGALHSGAGPASWCRDVVAATRSVHHVTDAVRSTCATARPTPTLTTSPLFGTVLADVLDRPAPTSRPASAVETGRVRRRTSLTAPAPAPTAEICPSGQQVRRTRTLAPLPSVERTVPPAAADCPPDEVPGSSARAERLTEQQASCRVPVGRLLTLAGPTSTPSSSSPTSPTSPASPAPPAAPARLRAVPAPPVVRQPRPTVPAASFAPALADRVARRLGTNLLGERFARTGPWPLDPTVGPTKARLLALALPARVVAAPATSDEAAPVRTRRRRDSRTPERTRPRAGSAEATTHPATPTSVPAAHPTPRIDQSGQREVGTFAEQPTEPARLASDDRSDESATGLGGAFQGAGRREMPAAPGVTPGTVAGLAEPDLERLMTRVLDDAARRHGIEV